MSYSAEHIKASHKFCFANRNALKKSSKCGCFHCLSIFPSEFISEWTAEADKQGDTGWCPICEIDSVIGDENHAINKQFLHAMRAFYFESMSNLDPVEDASYIDGMTNQFNKRRTALGLPTENYIP